jgi:hypothetical protein
LIYFFIMALEGERSCMSKGSKKKIKKDISPKEASDLPRESRPQIHLPEVVVASRVDFLPQA